MKPQAFVKADEPISGEVLHYTDCGLDNIYLRNGFAWETIGGEEYLSIADVDGLHRAIGRHIVMAKKAPTGAEVRFLRNELDMSQADLGKVIGVSDQSVARWEKGRTDIPGPAIFSMKILYLLSRLPADKQGELATKLIELAKDLQQFDEITDRTEFTFAHQRWADIAA